VLIAGGMGSEKKDPARSPMMGKKKRISRRSPDSKPIGLS